MRALTFVFLFVGSLALHGGTLDIPSGVFTHNEVEAAKAKAAEKNEPMTYVFTQFNTN